MTTLRTAYRLATALISLVAVVLSVVATGELRGLQPGAAEAGAAASGGCERESTWTAVPHDGEADASLRWEPLQVRLASGAGAQPVRPRARRLPRGNPWARWARWALPAERVPLVGTVELRV